MKEVKVRGRIYEQVVEPFNCIECPYETGCDAWGCTSPGCELTGECFGYSMKARECPFTEESGV